MAAITDLRGDGDLSRSVKFLSFRDDLDARAVLAALCAAAVK